MTPLDEFEEFAKKRGRKVLRGVVDFGENAEAANDFWIEAKNAGFNVIKRVARHGCYRSAEELSKLPLRWFVRLMYD